MGDSLRDGQMNFRPGASQQFRREQELSPTLI
jgi:hypothetical protein